MALYSKILLALDRNNEGLAAAEKVLLLEPNSPDGFLLKAAALQNLDRDSEAITYLLQP